MTIVSAETEQNGRKPRAHPRAARIKPSAIIAALLEDGWRFAFGGDDLYTYQHGVYVPGTRALRKHLFERLGSQWEPAKVSAAIQGLKDISPDLWLMPSQDYTNLSNGLYNRKIGRLEPHTPDHLSQVQLPISFDEAATCPGLTRFLEEVFPKDSSILAYEILGYLATTDTWLKRAVFLKGLQHSGKSTFCQLIHCFLGDRNITAHSLQHLTSNRFGLAGLHGKLANVLPDLPPARVDDSSIFKMITGNDHMVTGENKYERPFQFWMFCRLVFSANEFLQSADQTDAYLGRWLVLLFPNQFALNRTFLETLATPEELSGLFNLAMQAYRDVVVRGDFTNNEATQQGTELLKESLVPVIAFLKECCDVSNPKSRTNCTDLYQAFCGWCSQTGRRRPSDRTFYAQMRQHFPQGTEVKTDGNRVWAHLTLNDEGEQALEYFRRRERVGQ